MKRFRWHLLGAIVQAVALVLVMALGALTAAGQAGTGQLRFVHVIPGAAAVDIYIDGQLSVQNLRYGSASAYFEVDAGERRVTVTQSGVTTALFEQPITVEVDTATTLVAASTEPLAFTAYVDNLRSLPLGKTRLTAIHAISGAEAVDVLLSDGRIVIPSLQYGQPFGTFDVPADAYELGVAPAGGTLDSALIPAESFSLNSGTSYMLVIYGTPSTPSILVLTQPTEPEIAGGYVRLAHAVEGAPDVDVVVSDQVVAASLSEGDATGYIALPTGNFAVSVVSAEDGTELLSGSLDIVRDGYMTASVVGSVDAPELLVITDDLSALSASTGVVNVINGLADGTVSVNLDDDLVVVASVEAGASASGVVAPENASFVVEIEAGEGTTSETFEPSGGISGGMVYTVLVSGETPSVYFLDPVGLMASAISGAGNTVIVTEPTDAATEVVDAATVPPAATLDANVAQPTEVAPVVVVTATPTTDLGSEVVISTPTPPVVLPPPTIAPTPAFIARVLVDPNANLQLRQYPSREAFSLGLAPSNTALTVLGREGAPAPLPGATPTPTLDPENPPLTPTSTPFIDPVSLLEEGADLDPATTWLFVVYNTPDGGSISAWVNALYVDVIDPQGRRSALRNLPTIPRNRAGVASNTSVQPPSATQNVVTVIIGNLSAGVNVHVRRTPDAMSESLALVGTGTILELIGINEDEDWVFARYADASGGGVQGWVSREFISFALNGSPTDLDTLRTRNLLTVTSEEERGSTFAGGLAPVVAQPTASIPRDAIVGEVILDPGANLHLRRRPNLQAESLALIPAGTQLVVTGQHENGEWLSVTFEGIQGWVSSRYLYLTRNGRAFELTTVPILTNTPTATGTLSPEELELITPTAAP